MKNTEDFVIIILDFFGTQPIIGTIFGILFSLIGFTIGINESMDTGLNNFVKDMFQITAWSFTIIISILTIIGWIKTNKPFKKNE